MNVLSPIRHLKRSLSIAAAVAVASGALLSAGTSLADTVGNNIDASVDASLENMNLISGGATGTVQFSVVAENGDGMDGCNVNASGALTVALHSSNTAVATVSPASLTFENCTAMKAATVTPVGTGTAYITLTQTSSTGSGSFNLAGATFSVVVTAAPPADTTPPVITANVVPAANAAGWNKTDVSLSWVVSDPESPISSSTGCEAAVFHDESASIVRTCTATSAGGTASKSVTIKIDRTKPVLDVRVPAQNAVYALNANVLADWSASDALSGVAQAQGTVASGQPIDTSSAGLHLFRVRARDAAGNTAFKFVLYRVSGEEDNDHGNGHDNDNDHGKRAERQKMICHKGRLSISVGLPGVRAHLRHGDTIGRCQND